MSRKAVNRYDLSMREIGRRLQESREIAEVWVAKLGSQPSGQVGYLINEALRTLALELTQKVMEGELTADSLPGVMAHLKDLALAEQRLARSASGKRPPRAADPRRGAAAGHRGGRRGRGARRCQAGPQRGDRGRHQARRAGDRRVTPGISGDLLLPYQKRWIADRSQWKIAEKGRRTGLTWAEAADAVLETAATGGCNHSYVGSGREMAREFIDAAAGWAKSFGRAASEVSEEVLDDDGRDIAVFRIDFASGHHIQALSSNPSNLRGRKGNVTIDEAAFQPSLLEVVKAAAALTMWGGKVRVISTHDGDESEFNELLIDARAGRNDYSVHRITLDDACADGLYRRICEVAGRQWSPAAERDWKAGLRRNAGSADAAAEEYDCVPMRGGGAWLPLALIESCMAPAPVLRLEGSARFNALPERFRESETREWCERELDPLLAALDPERRHCLGEDFGRNIDLTVLAPLEVGRDMKRRCPFLVELRNMPFRQQEQILFRLCDGLPRLGALKLDARGNGQYLAEQAGYRYGGRVEAVMLTQAWYLENMPPFKAGLEDGLIEIPRDDDVASDLRALQLVKGIPRLPEGRTGARGDRHGDAAIALAMAHAASRAEVPSYRCVRVPRPGSEAWRDDPDFEDERDWRQVRVTAGFRRGLM